MEGEMTYEITFEKIALHYRYKDKHFIITAPKLEDEQQFNYTRKSKREYLNKLKINTNKFCDVFFKTRRSIDNNDIDKVCKQIYLMYLCGNKNIELIENFEFRDIDRENIYCIRE